MALPIWIFYLYLIIVPFLSWKRNTIQLTFLNLYVYIINYLFRKLIIFFGLTFINEVIQDYIYKKKYWRSWGWTRDNRYDVVKIILLLKLFLPCKNSIKSYTMSSMGSWQTMIESDSPHVCLSCGRHSRCQLWLGNLWISEACHASSLAPLDHRDTSVQTKFKDKQTNKKKERGNNFTS